MKKKILLLSGDGIGPEIIKQAEKLIDAIKLKQQIKLEVVHGDIGGLAIDKHNDPLPQQTIALAEQADAVLLGAVGGTRWDHLPAEQRPEKGLLRIRKHFDLFANLRPTLVYDALINSSSLKPALVRNLDLLIIRELTSGIYFGQPRGIKRLEDGQRYGYNTYGYTENEITRIAHIAFQTARLRQKKLCSVDKANVLEATRLWRDVVNEVATSYPDVSLSHMYVDNAAMQLVIQPKQFDVIVTGNMFGDILSDCAASLTGSIGMLPSASLNAQHFGLYEPIHGSAPDIAGKDQANPIATLLSLAMLFRYSLQQPDIACNIEQAVIKTIAAGYRTVDISEDHTETKAQKLLLGTESMGDKIVEQYMLNKSA